MTIVEGPKTLADFKEVRNTIKDLMVNPYCDSSMYKSLQEKRRKIDAQIEEYKQSSMLDCPDCGGDGTVVETGAECCGKYKPEGM